MEWSQGEVSSGVSVEHPQGHNGSECAFKRIFLFVRDKWNDHRVRTTAKWVTLQEHVVFPPLAVHRHAQKFNKCS